MWPRPTGFEYEVDHIRFVMSITFGAVTQVSLIMYTVPEHMNHILILSKGGRSGHVTWRRRDAITAHCHGGLSAPLDQASHPEPCLLGCLFGLSSVGSSHFRPSARARSNRPLKMSCVFRYRSATGTVLDVLASIGSGYSYTTLLAAANTTLVVFGAATPVLFTVFFVFALREMEVDLEHNGSYQPEGEPMLVDGLPFPHIVGEDGQHTVQHIDM
jgi:hypothetical protein